MSDLFEDGHNIQEVLIEDSIKASYLDYLLLVEHCRMHVMDSSPYTEGSSMR